MTPTYRIITGDCRDALRTLPAESVQCVVTSPPYWGLRDYGLPPTAWADGWIGCLGLEPTPEMFVAHLVEVFQEVRRVLRPDGIAWVNLGDCYATGAGKVGDHPGGGKQGARWRGQDSRGYRGDRLANGRGDSPAVLRRKTVEVGPRTQPNRLPIPGLKPKDLVGIPWRVAFALQSDGWWLRSDIIWHKPNPMPESVSDRPTKAHEYLFLLTRSREYFYDAKAIAEPLMHPRESSAEDLSRAFSRRRRTTPTPRQEPARVVGEAPTTRNKRSVWSVATAPFVEAHFATFPEELVRPCILAGSRPGDLVLDPFNGAGTTGVVALKVSRSYVGCELNPDYVEMSRRRLASVAPLLTQEVA